MNPVSDLAGQARPAQGQLSLKDGAGGNFITFSVSAGVDLSPVIARAESGQIVGRVL